MTRSLGGALCIAGLVVAQPYRPELSSQPTVRTLPRLGTPPDPWKLPAVTAFVHVAVVPMDRERVLQDQTVVVRGGRIVALGPSTQVAVPAGAAQVDGRGKFLIPGLADMHAHIREGIKAIALADRQVRWEQQLFLWLAHGLTTVRIMDHTLDVPGPTDSVNILKLRARQAAGKLLGPRIYTAGYLPPNTNDAPLQLDEVAAAVAAYKAAGYDFIKVHSDVAPNLEVFDSLAATARRVGLPLAGHAMAPMARMLETYKSIEHLTGYFADYFSYADSGSLPLNDGGSLDDLLPRMQALATATQRAGVWNCPTLYNQYLNENFGKEFRDYTATPTMLAYRRLVKALQDAGAGLLAGSDRLQTARSAQAMVAAGLTREQRRLEIMHGDAGATHHELVQLVAAGLTPYQALMTATHNVAAYFGTLDSSGTVAVGKRADLVLLGGDPLADIHQTEQIAGVMLGGRWLDRAELDRHMATIGTWADQHCPAAWAAAADSGKSRYRDAPCLVENTGGAP